MRQIFFLFQRKAELQAIIEEAALDGGWLLEAGCRLVLSPTQAQHTTTHAHTDLPSERQRWPSRNVLRPGWQARQRPNASAAVVGLRSM